MNTYHPHMTAADPAARGFRPDSVRAFRKTARLTQNELAALVGVHGITVSKWELGKASPTPWQKVIITALMASPRVHELQLMLHMHGPAKTLAAGLNHLL